MQKRLAGWSTFFLLMEIAKRREFDGMYAQNVSFLFV